MELVLMHFNAQQGPIAFDAIPKAISKEIEAALIRLFDVSEGEGIEENFKWRWHRGKFQVARQIIPLRLNLLPRADGAHSCPTPSLVS